MVCNISKICLIINLKADVPSKIEHGDLVGTNDGDATSRSCEFHQWQNFSGIRCLCTASDFLAPCEMVLSCPVLNG